MASQAASKGDVLQRIGGIGLLAGAILTAVGNLLVPRPDDPTVLAGYIKVWTAEPDRTRLGFFLILVGLWALIAGFVAVYRSLTGPAAIAWARMGAYGVVGGTAVLSVALALGIAGTKLSEGGAPVMAATTAAAAATDSVFGVSIIGYWSALTLLGIGLSVGTKYPRWTGWLLVIGGAVAVLTGGVLRVFGGNSESTELVFGAAALLTSVVEFVLGVLITRREMKAM
jgi:hypothetical protein